MTDQSPDLRLNSYRYHLPEGLIAQRPADRRDRSKIMVVRLDRERLEHRQFSDIGDYLNPGDVVVMNDTKVFPARLEGRKTTGGRAEVFLLQLPRQRSAAAGCAEGVALIKSSKRPRTGSAIELGGELYCTVEEYFADGKAAITLHYPGHEDIEKLLNRHGQVPLPPYIARSHSADDEDASRYQTVFAEKTGAVAAPTAGLHFTPELLGALAARGVVLTTITLHVGYGTFAPVREEDITRHRIHSEYLEIGESIASLINRAKAARKRIWAVGTTTVRALEFAARGSGTVTPRRGWCDLYIYPGFEFRVIDNLITNFHLPDSSLMFLVAALCGRERLLRCYAEAVGNNYRFYSYGDAMAIVTPADPE